MLCIVICEDDGKDLAYIKRIVDEYCAVHVKHSRRLKGGLSAGRGKRFSRGCSRRPIEEGRKNERVLVGIWTVFQFVRLPVDDILYHDRLPVPAPGKPVGLGAALRGEHVSLDRGDAFGVG